MISRRRFGLGLVGATATLAGSRVLAAPATTDVTFTAYAMPTQWQPIKQLHNWPLDHTCVATSSGMQWGCYGRTYPEDPSVATVVATGPGDDLWAKAIAGPDGHAGIDYGVTGVCDQCSNRILLPAGLTVRNSPGNEIATLLSGIYGLKLAEFATRVKDAAAAVNKEHPGRIPEAKVEAAVALLGGGLKDEWALVRANNERLIKPVLGAQQYAIVAPDIEVCLPLALLQARSADPCLGARHDRQGHAGQEGARRVFRGTRRPARRRRRPELREDRRGAAAGRRRLRVLPGTRLNDDSPAVRRRRLSLRAAEEPIVVMAASIWGCPG